VSDRERNEREWNDPRNWKGLRWSPFYFGAEDTRPFVPKRGRRRGYTVNFAHPLGRALVFAAASLALVGVAVALLTGRRGG
jgi:uncharacterized membrane protein